MTPPLHLAPGSEVPVWIEDLEREAFGKPWGELDDHEHVWALPARGFARWHVVPYAAEAELIRIAVGSAERRRGHARELLRHSQGELWRMGIDALFLEVRVSNGSARRLYEGEGWREYGIRPGYYRDGEDAALYRLDRPAEAAT